MNDSEWHDWPEVIRIESGKTEFWKELYDKIKVVYKETKINLILNNILNWYVFSSVSKFS